MKGSTSHARRAVAALVLVTALAGHAERARADAISDQKKAYDKRG